MERDGNLDFESAMGYFSNMFPTLTKQTIKDILESLKISENLRVGQTQANLFLKPMSERVGSDIQTEIE